MALYFVTDVFTEIVQPRQSPEMHRLGKNLRIVVIIKAAYDPSPAAARSHTANHGLSKSYLRRNQRPVKEAVVLVPIAIIPLTVIGIVSLDVVFASAAIYHVDGKKSRR